jgi:hypothetical protein
VVPAVPLTITNGVVGIPGDYWQGTVSPQGIAVMRNPKLSRVEAQIDRQGTIRGQYSGELPSDLLARISGIGGGDSNCIILGVDPASSCYRPIFLSSRRMAGTYSNDRYRPSPAG